MGRCLCALRHRSKCWYETCNRLHNTFCDFHRCELRFLLRTIGWIQQFLLLSIPMQLLLNMIWFSSLGREARKSIALALYHFHKSTCLWFTPRRNETDYLRIVRGEGYVIKLVLRFPMNVITSCMPSKTVRWFMERESRYEINPIQRPRCEIDFLCDSKLRLPLETLPGEKVKRLKTGWGVVESEKKTHRFRGKENHL